MLCKLAGLFLLAVGLFVGASILVALIGTALGLLWFLLKIAVPLILVYMGYRLLFADRGYA